MNIFPFKCNSSVPILLRPIALLFVVAGIMMMSACGNDDCIALQDFYDDCCDACGASSSYCGSDYDVTDETKAYCSAELDDELDLGCVCG